MAGTREPPDNERDAALATLDFLVLTLETPLATPEIVTSGTATARAGTPAATLSPTPDVEQVALAETATPGITATPLATVQGGASTPSRPTDLAGRDGLILVIVAGVLVLPLFFLIFREQKIQGFSKGK